MAGHVEHYSVHWVIMNGSHGCHVYTETVSSVISGYQLSLLQLSCFYHDQHTDTAHTDLVTMGNLAQETDH